MFCFSTIDVLGFLWCESLFEVFYGANILGLNCEKNQINLYVNENKRKNWETGERESK